MRSSLLFLCRDIGTIPIDIGISIFAIACAISMSTYMCDVCMKNLANPILYDVLIYLNMHVFYIKIYNFAKHAAPVVRGGREPNSG